tara:strand:- start:162 stop:518 length:357 start_codon:yes stop_codon:yes gene_type:complete
MESNTIFTIETPELTAKLDKTEISIIHYIESWLPTFMDWNVEELSYKCNLFAEETTAAVDMLILYGLLTNAEQEVGFGRRVCVTGDGAKWMRDNAETIRSINYMNDTDTYDVTEIAEA